MKRKFDLFLDDILTAIEKIESYTEHLNFDKFKEEQMVIDATIRNLEIIGEAVFQIPDSTKKKYPHVEWQKIKDFRNVVVHKYFTVDLETLWDIITEKLEPLEGQIKEILEKEQ